MKNKRAEIDEFMAAELRDAVVNADYFTVMLFLGTGQYEKHAVKTLAIAREAGVLMEDIAKNGRKAMVYAVLKSGRAVFVPADYQSTGVV